jgi:hypothetical protein
MGTKPSTTPRCLAEKFADMTGLEFRFSSVDYSAFDLKIKDSALLTLLTFGYVLGLTIDVWAIGEDCLSVRVKLKVRQR